MHETLSDSVLAAAEVFDARGDHDEAINVLARATQQGNLIAKTRLGKRLLVGDRAPYLPREGAEFILEAAQAGYHEAVAQVAVFQCIGVCQRKNWQQALNTLAQAAALGSHTAREQLVLLAHAGEPAVDERLLANPDPDHWRRLPTAINLRQWLSSPPGNILNEAPLIKAFPDFLPAPVCRRLIRLSRPRLKPALVYDAVNKRNYQSPARTNSIAEFNLVENDLIHFLIQEHMSAACGVPMRQMEGTAILNYLPGQEISDHYDFIDPALPNYQQEIAENGQRIITFLIYLNDDYRDGETVFPKLNLRHKGRTGEGLFFVNALADGASDLRALHAGTPPAAGEKWVVSQFIRNREVKYIL
jgi:hypothetical protein